MGLQILYSPIRLPRSCVTHGGQNELNLTLTYPDAVHGSATDSCMDAITGDSNQEATTAFMTFGLSRLRFG